MSRRMRIAAVIVIVLVAVFAAAQLISPDRTNPVTDASRAIQAQVETTSALAAVLNRSCRDCHSNENVWLGYTQVAPLSWLMQYGVAEGRKAVNFSEWANYPPQRRRELLVASCQDASSAKMPGSPYTLLHPESRLSAQDIETICAAVR